MRRAVVALLIAACGGQSKLDGGGDAVADATLESAPADDAGLDAHRTCRYLTCTGPADCEFDARCPYGDGLNWCTCIDPNKVPDGSQFGATCTAHIGMCCMPACSEAGDCCNGVCDPKEFLPGGMCYGT